MTVKELIYILDKCNPDDVVMWDHRNSRKNDTFYGKKSRYDVEEVWVNDKAGYVELSESL